MKTNSPVPVPCLLIQYGATWENHFLNLVNWIKCYFFIPLHTKFILTITKTKYFVTQNWIDTNTWYLKWYFIQHYKWYIYILGYGFKSLFSVWKKLHLIYEVTIVTEISPFLNTLPFQTYTTHIIPFENQNDQLLDIYAEQNSRVHYNFKIIWNQQSD